MSSERSVKDVFGPYTLLMERAMGIEPTSEAWEALNKTLKAIGLAALSFLRACLSWKLDGNQIRTPAFWKYGQSARHAGGRGFEPRRFRQIPFGLDACRSPDTESPIPPPVFGISMLRSAERHIWFQLCRRSSRSGRCFLSGRSVRNSVSPKLACPQQLRVHGDDEIGRA